MKFILGDFNAQIGKETYCCPTIGKYSLHQYSSDNGKIIGFAASRDLIIGSSFVRHIAIHLGTWKAFGRRGAVTAIQMYG